MNVKQRYLQPHTSMLTLTIPILINYAKVYFMKFFIVVAGLDISSYLKWYQ